MLEVPWKKYNASRKAPCGGNYNRSTHRIATIHGSIINISTEDHHARKHHRQVVETSCPLHKQGGRKHIVATLNNVGNQQKICRQPPKSVLVCYIHCSMSPQGLFYGHFRSVWYHACMQQATHATGRFPTTPISPKTQILEGMKVLRTR